MSTSNQHYNQRFDTKSWEVVTQNNELKVKASYFAPGYSAAHHETREAAILHAMGQRITEIQKLKSELDLLSEMREKAAEAPIDAG